MIYLDYAATSYIKPDLVYDAVINAMKNIQGNPGRGGHSVSLEAGRSVYSTRVKIAEFFNLKNELGVVFTHNATMSLNMAIKGIVKAGDHVVFTSLAHNSVVRPVMTLAQKGVEYTCVYGDEKGQINPDDIEKAVKENTKLIISTHGSNLLGTIEPITAIGKAAKVKGITFLVDASQSAGVLDIDMEASHIDLLAAPGHKSMLGPKGTGILLVREGIKLNTILEGGTGSASEEVTQPEMMPDHLESGTLNTPGIIGLSAAIDYLNEKGVENIYRHEQELTQHFINQLENIDGIKVYGPSDAGRKLGVVSCNVKEMGSSDVAALLNRQYGIAMRPGLHCAPLAHKTIGTMQQGALRFSFGHATTVEEINTAVEALKEIVSERI
jgi:cysteine desulfurase family protein